MIVGNPSESDFHRLIKKTGLEYIFLISILIIATVLRFYKLGEWSFWIEEIHTLRHIQSLGIIDIEYLFSRKLFYFFIHLILMFLGTSELTARLFPAVLGIITIPLFYWFVKKSFGIPLALLAAFLLTISPWHIYWSQNARFYVYILLLYSTSLFSFYWGLDKNNIRYFVISIITLGLASATNAFAIILVIIFILYILLLKLLNFKKPTGIKMRILVYLILIPLSGYLFYEFYLFTSGNSFLFLKIYNLFFNQETLSFLGYENSYVMLTSVVYYVGVPIVLLTFFGSYHLLKKKNRLGLLIIIATYLPLITIMFLTSFASTSNRYVFMTLPCWIILATIGVKKLYNLTLRNAFFITSYFLPLVIISVKDPVYEDVLFFIKSEKTEFFILGAFIVVSVFFTSLLAILISSKKNKVGIYLFSVLVLLPTIIHPIFTDRLYFAYQHGHRDNWKALSQLILSRRSEDEPVITYVPPLAHYYLGDPVLDILDLDINQAIKQYKKLWIVEDESFKFVSGLEFDKWAQNYCILIDDWDVFTGGRTWKLRLHMCSQDQ